MLAKASHLYVEAVWLGLSLLLASGVASRVGEEEDLAKWESPWSPKPVNEAWMHELGGESYRRWYKRAYSFGCKPNQPCCMCVDDSHYLFSTCYEPRKSVTSALEDTKVKRAKAGTHLCCEWKTPFQVHDIVEKQNHAMFNGYELEKEWYDHAGWSGRASHLWDAYHAHYANVTELGSTCFGLPSMCETNAVGEPVYLTTSRQGRLLELIQMSVQSLGNAFESTVTYVSELASTAWNELTWENIGKKGTEMKAYLGELVQTKTGWWSIFKVLSSVTFFVASLACPACGLGFIILAGTWSVAISAVDAIIAHNSGTNVDRAVAGFVIGVISSVASVLTFVHISPHHFMNLLSDSDTAFSFLLAMCDIVTKSVGMTAEELDSVQMSTAHMDLTELGDEKGAVEDALAASKDGDNDVVTCGMIREAEQRALTDDPDSDCPIIWEQVR